MKDRNGSLGEERIHFQCKLIEYFWGNKKKKEFGEKWELIFKGIYI